MSQNALRDIGLLALRVGIGAMMLFGHGLGKLDKLMTDPSKFADPFGVGPELSLALAVFAEVVCSALLILGLFTRLAALPLLVTMGVAVLVVHGADPWAKKELALLYALPVLTLLLTGPGGLSLDRLIRKKA